MTITVKVHVNGRYEATVKNVTTDQTVIVGLRWGIGKDQSGGSALEVVRSDDADLVRAIDRAFHGLAAVQSDIPDDFAGILYKGRDFDRGDLYTLL